MQQLLLRISRQHKIVKIWAMSFILMQCSSVPELSIQLRSDSLHNGKIIVSKFQTPTMIGAWIIGDYLKQSGAHNQAITSPPGLFQVELQMMVIDESKKPDLKLQDFQLSKNGVVAPLVTPQQIFTRYRTDSIDSFPFEFRMVAERPAFSKAELAAKPKDTVSPYQHQLRLESAIFDVDTDSKTIQLTALNPKFITLFFELPAPDSKHPYTISHLSNQIPPVSFYYEAVSSDKVKATASRRSQYQIQKDEETSKQIQDFLHSRQTTIDTDYFNLFDEHHQLHDHDTLRAKSEKDTVNNSAN